MVILISSIVSFVLTTMILELFTDIFNYFCCRTMAVVHFQDLVYQRIFHNTLPVFPYHFRHDVPPLPCVSPNLDGFLFLRIVINFLYV